MIKLCVSMWSFQELLDNGAMDFSQYADFLCQHKVNYAELLDFYIPDIDAAMKILGQRGIQPAVWSICNDFVQDDAAQLQKQISYVCSAIDIAKKYEIPLMRVFSGDAKDSIGFEEGLSSIKKAFAACVPYAEKNGIILCLENHGVFSARSEVVEEILNSCPSPYFRSNFDTANFLFVDEDPNEAIDRLYRLVPLLHIKDYRKSDHAEEGWPSLQQVWYTGCPVGKGVVDFPYILRKIESNPYDVVASLELESENPMESAAKSLAFLRGESDESVFPYIDT